MMRYQYYLLAFVLYFMIPTTAQNIGPKTLHELDLMKSQENHENHEIQANPQIEKLIEEVASLKEKVQTLEHEAKQAHVQLVNMSNSVTYFINNVSSMFTKGNLLSDPVVIYTNPQVVKETTSILQTQLDLKFVNVQSQINQLNHQMTFLMGTVPQLHAKKVIDFFTRT